jgi:agmatinase
MSKKTTVDPYDLPMYSGFSTFMKLPYSTDLEGIDFAVLGIPMDIASAFAVGQRFAPRAIRQASFDCQPYNRELDVEILAHLSGVDYGDVRIVPGNNEESHKNIEAVVLDLLSRGVAPFGIGGDHSITISELRAVNRFRGKVALVHFDAHHDAFLEYYGETLSQACPVGRAIAEGCVDPEHSIQLGMREAWSTPHRGREIAALGIKTIYADELHEMGTKEASAQIRERVGSLPVFLTFDSDFLDPAYAPGTCLPTPGGFSTRQAFDLLRGIRGIDLVGGDVVCVLPAHDTPGNITSIAMANVLWYMISLKAYYRKMRT